jgi:hypothetical protein
LYSPKGEPHETFPPYRGDLSCSIHGPRRLDQNHSGCRTPSRRQRHELDTDISLTNNTATTIEVELVFHPEDGMARSRFVTLGPNQSLLLADAVGPALFGGLNPASWLGQLEVRSPGDIHASAHIFTQGVAGGTFGSTYDDFDPSVLSSSGSIAGLISSTHFRSNVAFANSNDQATAFTYVLRREDGSIAATRHVDVAPHATRQLSLGDDVAVSLDDRRLSLTWTADRSGYVVASIVDNKSGDPTSAPSTSRDATSLFYPVVGKTAGNNATSWSTSVAVTSNGDGAGSVTFVYVDNATGLPYTSTSSLGARGTVKTEDLNALVGAPPGTGSLRINSTMGAVGAVRVFNTQADGSTFGSAILPQSNVVQSSKVRVKGVRRDDDYRLNVAISNDDTNATDGTVRLFDDRGVEVENEPFHLEHGKSTQVSMWRGDKVGSGEVEVETHNGIAVTVVASNVDNRTGDTMQHEAEQENERQNEVEIEIAPHTAAAGSPVAFSLKHAGNNVTGVAWTFGDGATATTPAATHAYASAGEFEVNAQVTLTGGAIVRLREDVHITGGGIVPPGQNVTAIDFSTSPAAPKRGQPVTFTASFDRQPPASSVVKWRFPDNSRPEGVTASYTFATAGSYTIRVQIEQPGQPSIEREKNVTVSP